MFLYDDKVGVTSAWGRPASGWQRQKRGGCSSEVERLTVDQDVEGSNPFTHPEKESYLLRVVFLFLDEVGFEPQLHHIYELVILKSETISNFLIKQRGLDPPYPFTHPRIQLLVSAKNLLNSLFFQSCHKVNLFAEIANEKN